MGRASEIEFLNFRYNRQAKLAGYCDWASAR